MHLPDCFLLTRLFQGHPFYRAASCRSKVFQVSPLPPASYLFYCALVRCYCCIFYMKLEGSRTLLYNVNVDVSPVPAASLETSSRKERRSGSLSCVGDSVLITRETTPCTWSSTSRMLTGHFPLHSDSFFYCPFTNLWQ